MGDPIPQYQRLYRLLRAQIERGRFAVGDRFYSQNELIRKFRLSYSTVARALEMLERDGLIERRHGKGTFVHFAHLPNRGDSQSASLSKIEMFFRPPRFEFDFLKIDTLYLALQRCVGSRCDPHLKPYPADPEELYARLLDTHDIGPLVFLDPPENFTNLIQDASTVRPTLVVGHTTAAPEVATLAFDFAQAGELAAVSAGTSPHEPVAVIVPSERQEGMLTDFLRHFSKTLEQTQAVLPPEYIIRADASDGGGYGGIHRLYEMSAHSLPAAMVLVGTELTYGALTALRELRHESAAGTRPQIIAVVALSAVHLQAAPIKMIGWSEDTIALEIATFLNCLARPSQAKVQSILPTIRVSTLKSTTYSGSLEVSVTDSAELSPEIKTRS